MDCAVNSEELRLSQPQATAAGADHRAAGPAWPGERTLTLADARQAIALVEAAGRVESDLARTLHALAAQGHGEASARQLRLAEDAARGAQAAAATSARLGQLAGRLAEAAQYADDLARDLRLRAAADAVVSQPGPALATDIHRGQVLDESPASRRLADIDRRLAELRRARLMTTGDLGPQGGKDAQRRVLEAGRHQRESAAHLQRTQQLTVAALLRAARAHDRAAEASARSARSGIGDVAEHNRRAAFHRAAANADRQQASAARTPS